MIARIWHGRTLAGQANAYLEYINQTGVPDYRQTPGNLGVFVFRQIEGTEAHFLTLSLWDSYESIQRFAGDEYQFAKYYPEDEQYLLEFEPNVQHYEVSTSFFGGFIPCQK